MPTLSGTAPGVCPGWCPASRQQFWNAGIKAIEENFKGAKCSI
jgi:hypothetical protein